MFRRFLFSFLFCDRYQGRGEVAGTSDEHLGVWDIAHWYLSSAVKVP